jgi:integrator complex subunit 4
MELCLLDDAFIKICDLVNDSSMPVRALAAELLGDFHAVEHKFLEQTLDKKLMSHLKIVKSDHQRQRELHQGGGATMDWESGRKWGGGAPKVRVPK